LLAERELKLGVCDTLTDGQLVRDLIEAGFGDLISTDSSSNDLTEVLKAAGLELSSQLQEAEKQTLATTLAEKVSLTDGCGLAMLGPFEDNSTWIALRSPGDMHLLKRGRNYQATDHVRRWLVVQGLDWIRRVVLGQLESPIDWH